MPLRVGSPSGMFPGRSMLAWVLCPSARAGAGAGAGQSPHPPIALQWMSAGKTEASIYQQAEDGKTELSLMHFAITNPRWQPPRESTAFIGFLKERVHRESSVVLAQQAGLPDNALFTSIQSLQSESEVPAMAGDGAPAVPGRWLPLWATENGET